MSILTLLLMLVMFLNLDTFVDEKILPKWYSFVLISLLSAAGTVIFCQNKRVTIDKLTLVFVLLLGYMTIREVVSERPIIEIPLFISLVALFLFFQIGFRAHKITDMLILLFCLTQAVFGLLQYTMVVPTHQKFAILGSYANPSGFATNLAIAFPLIFRFTRRYKLLTFVFATTLLLAVILSGSRTGLLVILLAMALHFYHHIPTKFRRYSTYIIFILLFLGAILGIYLFFSKEDSAIGRVLIWKVTGKTIMDNLFFGGGSYAFPRDYMQYQANYFIQNPNSKYVLLADNIMYPFNEYLLVFMKYGMVAILLLIYGCVLIVKSQKISSPYTLCLISIGVFSLFSYPFLYPITWVVLIYCMVRVSRNNKSVLYFNIRSGWNKTIVMIFLCTGFFFLVKDIRFEYKWNKIAKISLSGRTEDMLPYYGELFSSWNGNHLFLYNYAAELGQVHQYSKSLEILNKAIQYWNDYDIQLLYANNYMQLQKWDEAEMHLKLASNMCPNRFVPLFNLYTIYSGTNRKREALNIAYLILHKKVKIPSATIYSIKNQMRRYVHSESNND